MSSYQLFISRKKEAVVSLTSSPTNFLSWDIKTSWSVVPMQLNCCSRFCSMSSTSILSPLVRSPDSQLKWERANKMKTKVPTFLPVIFSRNASFPLKRQWTSNVKLPLNVATKFSPLGFSSRVKQNKNKTAKATSKNAIVLTCLLQHLFLLNAARWRHIRVAGHERTPSDITENVYSRDMTPNYLSILLKKEIRAIFYFKRNNLFRNKCKVNEINFETKSSLEAQWAHYILWISYGYP
jgi:hypothetical protein